MEVKKFEDDEITPAVERSQDSNVGVPEKSRHQTPASTKNRRAGATNPADKHLPDNAHDYPDLKVQDLHGPDSHLEKESDSRAMPRSRSRSAKGMWDSLVQGV